MVIARIDHCLPVFKLDFIILSDRCVSMLFDVSNINTRVKMGCFVTVNPDQHQHAPAKSCWVGQTVETNELRLAMKLIFIWHYKYKVIIAVSSKQSLILDY